MHSNRPPSARPADRFLSAVLLVVLVTTAGCTRQQAAPSKQVLVYCTPDVKPYARCIADALREVTGADPVLASVRPRDLVSALAATRAGDFVVCLQGSVPSALDERQFVSRWHQAGHVSLGLISRTECSLADLCQPGVRIGWGTPGGTLEAAISQSLSPSERQTMEANIVYRSERCAELIRLVRLGALDAAFIWAPDTPPADLHAIRIPPERGATRDLLVGTLSCSRQPGPLLERVRSAWSTGVYAARLAGLGLVLHEVGGRP